MIDQTLNRFAALYYPLYSSLGITLNLLLYYLIFTKTTRVFKSMKYFLIPSNTATMFVSSCAFFLQVRTVHNTQSMAIMGQGYCKYIRDDACFHSYILLLAAGSVVGLLNIHTIFYRMIVMNQQKIEVVIKKLLMFCIHYTAALVILVFSYIPEMNITLVYNDTITQHPDYDFEPFGRFGGFVNSHSVYQTTVTLSMVFLTIYGPIFGFYCRRNALRILEFRKKSLSERSVVQFRTLIHGLTLQSILPLVCYTSVAGFYLYNKYSENEQLIFPQYLFGMVTSLPSVFDPLLTIYFILPYRNELKRIVQDRIRQKSISGIETDAGFRRTSVFRIQCEL